MWTLFVLHVFRTSLQPLQNVHIVLSAELTFLKPYVSLILLQMTRNNFTRVCLEIVPIIRWFYTYVFLGVFL